MNGLIYLDECKLYYRIDEVARICKATIETILHHGANDGLELLTPIPDWVYCRGSYSIKKMDKKDTKYRTFQSTVSEGVLEPFFGSDFIVCDEQSLFDLEIYGESKMHVTRKIIARCPPNDNQFEEITPKTLLDFELPSLTIKDDEYAQESIFFKFYDDENDEVTISINKTNLFVLYDELARYITAHRKTAPETQEPKELNSTERQSLHSIIKILSNFIIDPSAKPEKEKSDSERGKPPFKNQTQLIEFLSDKEQGMGEIRGFSKANLEKVFSNSNKS